MVLRLAHYTFISWTFYVFFGAVVGEISPFSNCFGLY